MVAIHAAQASASSQDRLGLEFVALALTGKQTAKGFGKVIKLIDAMVETLKTEQDDDVNKKEYCAKQFDVADDSCTSCRNCGAGAGVRAQAANGSSGGSSRNVGSL